MNWKRGFKRITHILAIVIAVACGGVAGFLPIQQYDDAHTVSQYDLLLLPVEEYYGEEYYERAAEEETVMERAIKSDMNMADFVDQIMKDKKERSLKAASEKHRRIKAVLDNRRKTSFWYNLSRAKLIGMVVLYGLGGAVIGYVGTWVVLWYGGLAIFILAGWLILGFADKKPPDEQKQ